MAKLLDGVDWVDHDFIWTDVTGRRWRTVNGRTSLVDREPDPVNHPSHYTSHPSGVEVITITEHMNFCKGNAVKYILRSGQKGDEVEDLRKAVWYLEREIARISK